MIARTIVREIIYTAAIVAAAGIILALSSGPGNQGTDNVANIGKLQPLLHKAEDEGWRDWIRSEADEAAVLNGCYFDYDAGNRVVQFFPNYLRHTKGEWKGQPFELMDWQRDDVIMPLFGWKRADGLRRYRMAYIEIPKKNGKSALCSGLGIYLWCADGEPGAEVYAAAADRDQASIVFDEAYKMAMASPRLAPYIDPTPSRKNMLFIYDYSWNVFRALSADVHKNEGLNISALIFDELHAQKSREFWDTLRYGTAARREPLIVAITTAGWDRNSICWEQRELAMNIINGIYFDDTMFPYIRGANPDIPGITEHDDWKDPATWKKANPSYGVIIREEEMSQVVREAQESPPKENVCKRYRLNIWTEQAQRFLQMERWDACETPVDEGKLEGRRCFGGLDLASTTDIAALELVFDEVIDGNWYLDVVSYFWIPEASAVQRSRKDRVPYITWAKQGLIKFTPGNAIDYEIIRADINKLGERFDIQRIAVDRWNATQIVQQLEGDGFEMAMFGQGYASMNGPTKQLEGLVLQQRVRHGGNPVLRWMASNLAVETDAAGNYKPSKNKSTEKIDGMVALIMAVGTAGVFIDDTIEYHEVLAI